MFDSGHIKIHRKVIESAIWKNMRDWRLAETVLLMANWKPGVFQSRSGDVVKVGRGELITSLKSLKKKSGLTVQNIRTSLNHLEKAEFLTSTSTSHFRHIKVMKYGQYQDNQKPADKATNKDLTRTQQGPNNDIRRVSIEEEQTAGASLPLDGPGDKPYEMKTDLQRLMCAYKNKMGVPWDDRGWDKEQFPKWSRAGKKLIRAFGGDLNKAIDFLDFQTNEFDKKSISWTLATIAGKAWDRRRE